MTLGRPGSLLEAFPPQRLSRLFSLKSKPRQPGREPDEDAAPHRLSTRERKSLPRLRRVSAAVEQALTRLEDEALGPRRSSFVRSGRSTPAGDRKSHRAGHAGDVQSGRPGIGRASNVRKEPYSGSGGPGTVWVVVTVVVTVSPVTVVLTVTGTRLVTVTRCVWTSTRV